MLGIHLNSRKFRSWVTFLRYQATRELGIQESHYQRGGVEGASFCVFVAINVTFTQFEVRSLPPSLSHRFRGFISLGLFATLIKFNPQEADTVS